MAHIRRMIIACTILWALPAAAQTLPQTSDSNAALHGVCSGFLAQGAGGVSGDHARLCACLVRDTSTKLTRDEMSAYADASVNNRAPPPALMAKVTAIAAGCLREAQ